MPGHRAERYGKRLNSSMADMQEFYDAGMARIDDAMDYLDQFPLKAICPTTPGR